MNKMGKECNDCDDLNVATLKNELAAATKKIDDLTTQNKELTGKVTDAEKKAKDANDELTKYKEAEKKGLAESILKRSDFKAEDLKDKSVEDLRTIHAAIDHVKIEGTVKNVRGAGDKLPLNMTADGKIDPTKSVMGNPVRQADGSIKWVVKEQ